MPTTKPRIAITLNQHTYETIRRLAELNGEPMSRIVAELIEAVRDPLMRTVALLEAAREAPQQVKDGLRGTFEAMERDLYGAAGYAQGQVDWLIEELKPKKGRKGAEKPQRGAAVPTRAAGAGAGSAADEEDSFEAYNNARMRKSNPHVVTRGSGLPTGRKIKDLAAPPRKGKKGVRRG